MAEEKEKNGAARAKARDILYRLGKADTSESEEKTYREWQKLKIDYPNINADKIASTPVESWSDEELKPYVSDDISFATKQKVERMNRAKYGYGPDDPLDEIRAFDEGWRKTSHVYPSTRGVLKKSRLNKAEKVYVDRKLGAATKKYDIHPFKLQREADIRKHELGTAPMSYEHKKLAEKISDPTCQRQPRVYKSPFIRPGEEPDKKKYRTYIDKDEENY